MISDKLEEALGRRGELAVLLPDQDVAGAGRRGERNEGDGGVVEEVGHPLDRQAVVVTGPDQDDGVAGLVVAGTDVESALVELEDVADLVADDVAVGDDQGQLVEVIAGEGRLLGQGVVGAQNDPPLLPAGQDQVVVLSGLDRLDQAGQLGSGLIELAAEKVTVAIEEVEANRRVSLLELVD